METLEFTKEELGEAGRGNAEGLWLATVSYFLSKGGGLEDWIDYVGNIYAPGWDELIGKGAREAARIVALNWVSCGAKLLSFSGDDIHAELEIEFPTEDPQEFWKFSFADAHKINRVHAPIAKRLGLKFTWESKGNRFRNTFSK